MTYARHGLGCTQATNGKIYVIAGYNGSFLDYNEEYDPVANTWATRAPLYAAMHGVSVVAANNGKVYVIGGTTPADGYSGQSRVDAYDPATNSWSTVAPMSAARWSAAGVLASDGNIYVIGGRRATATTFTTVEAYNPTTDIWTSRAPLPAGALGIGCRCHRRWQDIRHRRN